MQRSPVLVLILGFTLGLGVGCSGGQTRPDERGGGSQGGKVKGDRTMVSHAEGLEPAWIQECPVRSDQILPFCGEAVEQASQAGACATAHAKAVEKLKAFIGQQVGAGLEAEGGGAYSFKLQGGDDQAISVRGVWEDSRWWEQYDGGSGQTYDCYVMLTYPALEYNALVGKAQAAARQRFEKAAALHAEGKELLDGGVPAQAKVRFQRALALLQGLKEKFQTRDGKNSEILVEQVNADLSAASVQESEMGSTLVVAVLMRMDGADARASAEFKKFEADVQNMVLQRTLKVRPGGLDGPQVSAVLAGDVKAAVQTARDKSAGYLLVVLVDVRHVTKDESGIYYSKAEGQVRLIRTQDGRELATANVSDRTGHPTSAAAANAKVLETIVGRSVKPALKQALDKIQ
ncbi:MAG TPA: hypothetical protein PK668_11750 [Myxococcota bacterium]|nr:hypothetical protein [Myxococcota bacterium]HRY93858.1 hypothetical protein [Myxococcota bacterium]HSA23599.1 hypothetical protein [Myxococcota bacterium]